MRRITIDEVRAACEATGYRLKQNVTLNADDRCGCPIGIVGKASGMEDRFFYSISDFSERLGLSEGYSWGLVYGFDGKCRTITNEERIIGYADGAAIRDALLPTA